MAGRPPSVVSIMGRAWITATSQLMVDPTDPWPTGYRLTDTWPLADLMAACMRYLPAAPRDFVTFEYVMLDGVNDGAAHAAELVELVRDVPCKMNLIPFNPFPGTRYKRSPAPVIQRFRDELIRGGVLATVRRTRGDDIDAACGQLAGRVIDRTTARLGNKVFGVAVQQ